MQDCAGVDCAARVRIDAEHAVRPERHEQRDRGTDEQGEGEPDPAHGPMNAAAVGDELACEHGQWDDRVLDTRCN